MAARRTDKNGADSSGGRAAPARENASRSAASKDNHEFVSEAEETLEKMFEDLSELHEQRHGEREVDPDLVNRIFRSAHSLKGLAGMFGLDGISLLAHRMEDILDGLRLGRVSFDSPVIELLDEGVSLLATLMTRLERGEDSEGEAGEDPAMVRAFLDRIEAAMNAPDPEGVDELARLELDASLLRALTEYEEHRLRENLRRGRNLSLVDSTFEIMAFEDGLSGLSEALREFGEVVSTLPSPGAAPESQIRFSLLVATEIDSAALATRLDAPNVEVRTIGSGNSTPSLPPIGSGNSTPSLPPIGSGNSTPSLSPIDSEDSTPSLPPPADPATEPVTQNVDPPEAPPEAEAIERSEAGPKTESKPSETEPAASVEPDPSEEAPESPEFESLRSISDTVRVDIRKLDELMNLVGELVIQRNAISALAGRLAQAPETARFGAELAKTHKLLDRKLKALQSGVLDVRMVPLRQIFEKLSRVVRRLRRDLGKEVDLEFKGAETELDKFIVEQLVDPLVHIVRNAFDHALESPEERMAAGKDRKGHIRVSAFQRGNHVVIEVEDDGRGMNAEAIRAKAIACGLIDESDSLSLKEILNLVFEPGLSTAEEVSSTSGRGVGMDVVRSNLGEMGGLVDLESEPGQGTTVTITLPITLAIIQALIVGVGEERYAIPLNSVLETLVVEPEQIGATEGREVLNLRGEPLYLRRLAEEFELEAARREGRQFVVVLGMGSQRLGLLVDRLEGQRDAVIKSIKGPVQQIRGIAGATELGDQGAILVIDVSAIVGDAFKRREAA